jgi:hypothetical protein
MELRQPVPVAAKTPGQAAHDVWCELDDWDLLGVVERGLREDAVQAGHAVIVAQEP